MTIYKPKGSPFYHFDFWHRGTRFNGSTKQTQRRAAERIEREVRERAKAAAWAAAGFERASKLIRELSDADLHKMVGDEVRRRRSKGGQRTRLDTMEARR